MPRRKRVSSPYVVVRGSRIHGRGVFAKKFIPKDTKVIEYAGDVVTKTEALRRADVALEKNAKDNNHGAVYVFELNKRYDVDGSVWWNTAKYINHSCDPNCETEISRGKIWITSIKDIRPGEELGYNYGYSYDEEFEDHPCLCGTDKCIGYILNKDEWPKLKRKKTLQKNIRRKTAAKHTKRRKKTTKKNNRTTARR